MFENYQIPAPLIPSDPRFGCGPSLIPTEHLKALADTGMHLMGTSHRKAPIKNLMKSAQTGLKQYFKLPDDYLVVMGNGGATMLFDMIPLGMARKNITHFTCGEFSEKWYQCSKAIPWLNAQVRSVEYGQGITPENVAGADVICATLNETSTGVQIDSLPQVGPDTILAVDATSGGGQVPCDVSKVDIFFFSPQKVFASEGGLYIAILSPKAKQRALEIAKDKNRYIPGFMDWAVAIDNSEKNQTYTTPAIASLFLLNEQVKLMNKLGYAKVVELAEAKAQHMYQWAQQKPYLSCYVKEDRYRSRAVATIDVDERVSVDSLLKKLEDSKVVYGIDAYRKLGRNQFRIAMFHNIKHEDLQKLTTLLSDAIESTLKLG